MNQQSVVIWGIQRQIIVRAVIGGEGEPGPPGPPGPPGSPDSPEQIRDKLNSLPDGYAYIHNQLIPSANWIVNHNLGYRPSTEVRDTGGGIIYTEIIHVSDNQLQVLFDSPLAGQVRLN